MRVPGRVAIHLLLLSAVACGGKHLDLGQDGDGGSGGDGGTIDGAPPGSDGAPVNPLSGIYKGYIESYKFPDGSDTVVMNLTFANDGTITGTVRLGAAPDLPPPTDPNATYPPGFREPQTGDYNYPLEGFDFTVLGGTYAAPPRIQLSIGEGEIWKRWCEIQTTIYPHHGLGAPPPDAGCGAITGYGCLPDDVGTGGMGNTCTWTSCDYPTPQPVDCGKLSLCTQGPMGMCTCTATSCTIPIPITGPGDTAFDMQLTSGALDGSVTLLTEAMAHNVHLTRQ